MAAESSSTPGGVLVVYYSSSGNTARVARDLAVRTHADLESLEDRARTVRPMGYIKAMWDALRGKTAELGPIRYRPADYALTLVGTPVWVGRMTPAVRAYLTRFASKLPSVAFFVTSGNTDVARVVPGMEKLVGQHAVASVGFSAAELANAVSYEDKLSRFLQALNRAPSGQAPGVAQMISAQ